MSKIYIPLLIIAIIFPLIVSNSYAVHLAILVLMWVVIGQSWNLLGGYTGQASFGHAAFFGAGAYGAGLIFLKFGISTWYGIIVGTALAALLAIPLGLICFRLRGPYFALSMLASAEVLRLITTNWRSITNGPVGILIIPSFQSKIPYYFVILGFALFALFLVKKIIKSKLGFYLIAIREDQDAAEAIGINSTKYKLISLIISGALAGLAGSFYMNYMGYIDPHIAFSLVDISITAILVVMIGGAGTFWGPAVGALIMVLAGEGFRSVFGHAHVLIYGILIILIIIFMPSGIIGKLKK